MREIKLLLPLILVLFVSTSLLAQFSVGFKTVPLVPNGSQLTGTFENVTAGKDSKDYIGYSSFVNFGVDFGYSFQENVSLYTGVEFKSLGYKDIDVFEIFSMDYLEVPLFFRYSKGNKTKFFTQIGASLKILTTANHEYRIAGVIYNDEVKDIYSSIVCVGNFGFGVIRELSDNLFLNAEWRFGYDLTQTVKKNDDVFFNSNETWNFFDTHLLQSAITIGVAYKFKSTNR